MRGGVRTAVQVLFTALSNGYLYGFTAGKIYQGPLKYACAPGLNCYSCPGALLSCPIGALQALLTQRGIEVPFGVLGFLFVFGTLLGRAVCGWLCPFGLVQDLLHKIPLFQKKKHLPGHRVLRFGPVMVLLLLVVLGSSILFTGFVKVPAFCKFLCPSGTLFGAVPLLLTNQDLRGLAGGLFQWKFAVLIVILVLSIKVFRPFCQYLCPLGAIYGFFNRFSLVQITLEQEACTGCGTCTRECPLSLQKEQISVSPECIRCGKCVSACPQGCLHFTPRVGKQKEVEPGPAQAAEE